MSSSTEPNGPHWGEPRARTAQSTVMGFQTGGPKPAQDRLRLTGVKSQGEERQDHEDAFTFFERGAASPGSSRESSFGTSSPIFDTTNIERVEDVAMRSGDLRSTETELKVRREASTTNVRNYQAEFINYQSSNSMKYQDTDSEQAEDNGIKPGNLQNRESEEKVWKRASALESDNFMNYQDWLMDLMIDDKANNIAKSFENVPKGIKMMFERFLQVGTPYIQTGITSAMTEQSFLATEKQIDLEKEVKRLRRVAKALNKKVELLKRRLSEQQKNEQAGAEIQTMREEILDLRSYVQNKELKDAQLREDEQRSVLIKQNEE